MTSGGHGGGGGALPLVDETRTIQCDPHIAPSLT